jgi:membrane protein YqaA with SNARE-associated domain
MARGANHDGDGMLQALYQRVLLLAASRNALAWLPVLAFAEASFFPIPPDVLLVPMALARPRHAWRLAAICTLASVVGGALGYLIGYALFDQLALPLLRATGSLGAFERFQAAFAANGLSIIFVMGASLIPYKIVTITAGAAKYNFELFMMASCITRGGRFFLEAAALWYFGERARVFIEQRLPLAAGAAVACVVCVFLAVHYW